MRVVAYIFPNQVITERYIHIWGGSSFPLTGGGAKLTEEHLTDTVGARFAVSSSPRPWMEVFALPEKSNMAVSDCDPDPKVRKMSITF